jgi:hypothetical protein
MDPRSFWWLARSTIFDRRSLAKALAPYFSVFTYDRRGRGKEAVCTPPYAVDREIRPRRAACRSGGAASVFGFSSGAPGAASRGQGLAIPGWRWTRRTACATVASSVTDARQRLARWSLLDAVATPSMLVDMSAFRTTWSSIGSAPCRPRWRRWLVRWCTTPRFWATVHCPRIWLADSPTTDLVLAVPQAVHARRRAGLAAMLPRGECDPGRSDARPQPVSARPCAQAFLAD